MLVETRNENVRGALEETLHTASCGLLHRRIWNEMVIRGIIECHDALTSHPQIALPSSIFRPISVTTNYSEFISTCAGLAGEETAGGQ